MCSLLLFVCQLRVVCCALIGLRCVLLLFIGCCRSRFSVVCRMLCVCVVCVACCLLCVICCLLCVVV